MIDRWRLYGEINFREEESDPMIISFGWTSDALLAGYKDTTRRAWDPDRIRREMARGHWRDRCVLDAWDALPRVVVKNPKPIAKIRLKVDCVYSKDMPDEDVDREGLRWLDHHGYLCDGIQPLRLWESWRWIWYGDPEHGIAVTGDAAPLWVVRFNVIELTQAGRDRRDQLLQEGKAVRPLPMVA